MNKIPLILSVIFLAGCNSTYESYDDLVGKLALSDGHSQCVSSNLAPLLNGARVVEVIPQSRDCTPTEKATSAISGSTQTCPRPVTAVHFERLSNKALTDSLDQDGWVTDLGPTRIAKNTQGGFSVFLPKQDVTDVLDAGECNLFERRIRSGLATHLAYAAALKEKGFR